MRNRVLAMVLLSTLLGGLSGCGASGADDGNAPVALPRQGSIRVVHAMPDAGRMTSFLSNSSLLGQSVRRGDCAVSATGRSVRDEHPADPAERRDHDAGRQRHRRPGRRRRVLVHHDRPHRELRSSFESTTSRSVSTSIRANPRSFRRPTIRSCTARPRPARSTCTSPMPQPISTRQPDRDRELRRRDAAGAAGCRGVVSRARDTGRYQNGVVRFRIVRRRKAEALDLSAARQLRSDRRIAARGERDGTRVPRISRIRPCRARCAPRT